MLSQSDYELAWSILDTLTPTKGDCGLKCNAKCCTDWQNDVGIYLFPGEEILMSEFRDNFIWETHSTSDYEFCPSWRGNFYFLRCAGTCIRSQRPLQCRLFPLSPCITPSGKLAVYLSDEYAKICPLICEGIDSIESEFVSSCIKVWKILLKDQLIYDDIIWQQRDINLEDYELRFF